MNKKYTVIEGSSIPFNLAFGTQIWESIDAETLKARQEDLLEERIFVFRGTCMTINPEEYEDRETELISEKTLRTRLDKRLAKNNKQDTNQQPTFFVSENTSQENELQNIAKENTKNTKKSGRRPS